MSYVVEYATDKREFEEVIEDKGVRVFVDPKSSLYLNGVILRYDDGLMGTGFQVENPNARTTCGCGESFSFCTRSRSVAARSKASSAAAFSICFSSRLISSERSNCSSSLPTALRAV